MLRWAAAPNANTNSNPATNSPLPALHSSPCIPHNRRLQGLAASYDLAFQRHSDQLLVSAQQLRTCPEAHVQQAAACLTSALQGRGQDHTLLPASPQFSKDVHGLYAARRNQRCSQSLHAACSGHLQAETTSFPFLIQHKKQLCYCKAAGSLHCWGRSKQWEQLLLNTMGATSKPHSAVL